MVKVYNLRNVIENRFSDAQGGSRTIGPVVHSRHVIKENKFNAELIRNAETFSLPVNSCDDNVIA